MEEGGEYRGPDFKHGTEVARSSRLSYQPGFDSQMTLIDVTPGLKKKLITAFVVIFSVFLGGMVLGAVAGFFI